MDNFEMQANEFLSAASSRVYINGLPPMDEGNVKALSSSQLQLTLFGNPPVRLFHYYPDLETKTNGETVNHSRDAVRTGTIHLSSPTAFNDPFECTVPVDAERLKLEAIRQYASIIGMAPLESNSPEQAAEEFLGRQCCPDKCLLLNSANENMKASASLFRLSMENSALKRNGIIGVADIMAGAQAVVDCAIPSFDQFRIFCFTRSFLNPIMWAHYANGHRGFCVEYDCSTVTVEAFPELDSAQKRLLTSIYPVIYGLPRPDCTSIVEGTLFHDADSHALDGYIKQSICRKALHWGLEEEWRLVLHKSDELIGDNGLVRFLPIKAIYAGALMDEETSLPGLKQLCENSGIDLYKMAPDKRTFELHPQLILHAGKPHRSTLQC